MKRTFLAFPQREDGSASDSSTEGMVVGQYKTLDSFLRFRLEKSGVPGTRYDIYTRHEDTWKGVVTQTKVSTYTVFDFGR